jgi:hypothetical protein
MHWIRKDTHIHIATVSLQMLPEKIYFEKCHAYTVQYTNFNKIIIFVLFSGIIHYFFIYTGWLVLWGWWAQYQRERISRPGSPVYHHSHGRTFFTYRFMKGIVARDFHIFVFKPLFVMPLEITRARLWFVFAFTELFKFECELAESPESADTCSESAVSQISLTH